MASSRVKLPKKRKQQHQEELVDEDDFLQKGNEHEESMGKHRHGNTVKALRFADRALEVYSEGLDKFPNSSNLAYNKARLQLEKALDPKLSEELTASEALDVLQQALTFHEYARDLDPTHPDILYNMAEVLTKMAELIAEDDEYDDSKAIQCQIRALEILTECYQLQANTFARSRHEIEQAMREAAQEDMLSNGGDSQLAPVHTTSGPQDVNQEGQWVSVEEPITAQTLLDTIITQLESLRALCSILSSSHIAIGSSELSWIKSYSTSLLTDTLPTLLNENHEALEPRLCDVMLPKAAFTYYYLELAFKMSTIDVDMYRKELDAAFRQPGLDPASESVLMLQANALLSFNSALANSEPGAYATLRWTSLIAAQSHLSKVAANLTAANEKLSAFDNKLNTNRSEIATTHSMRGDISLLLQILAYPPNNHPQAHGTTSNLLNYAGKYYHNASILFRRLDPPAEEEKDKCELREAVVNVLKKVNTIQTAAGSSSGQGNGGSATDLSALASIVQVHGEQWVREEIEDMVSEGLVLPQIASEIIGL